MAALTPEQIEQEVAASIGKGIRAAAIFLTARIKEELSVAAPRKAVVGSRGLRAGVRYYRATTPATKGAPPRKLSGRLRSSIGYSMADDGLRARVGTNVVYAPRLEFGGHPFLQTIIDRHADDVLKIIGDTWG